MLVGMNNTRLKRKILVILDFKNDFFPTYLQLCIVLNFPCLFGMAIVRRGVEKKENKWESIGWGWKISLDEVLSFQLRVTRHPEHQKDVKPNIWLCFWSQMSLTWDIFLWGHAYSSLYVKTYSLVHINKSNAQSLLIREFPIP